MFALLERISLPLLLKELLEQSARRRTYIIRVAYATLFFLASMTIIIQPLTRAGNSVIGILGVGQEIFTGIIAWQFGGIYLFLPALACGALTVEKERNTLGLLFLTKLGTWTIIFEKLLSRLLPMFCLMLCSLPLLAFTMSLGGVNNSDLFIAVWFLSLTAFQICAISIACSAVMRTTTGALLTCYALIFLLGFGPPIVDWLIFDGAISRVLETLLPEEFDSDLAAYCFIGFASYINRVQATTGISWLHELTNYCVCLGVPLIGSGLLALLIARLCLVRRAFIPASNPLLYLLRVMDRTFNALNNNRITRGIVVIREANSQPAYAPIAWRETHKRSLGQTRYLIRILVALELPVLFVVMAVISRSAVDTYNNETIATTTMIVWLVVALLITVTSAGLIAGERGRQTLDILLTLPLDGRQIILDKVAGVTRLAWVCAVPLITSIGFEAWWRDIVGNNPQSGRAKFVWWEYLLTELSMVAVYLPLMMWLALWIGLKTKSPTRATLTALVAAVGWCIVPLIAFHAFWEPNHLARNSMLLQLSPFYLLVQNEFESLRHLSPHPLMPMFVNLLIYGSCLLLVRWRVLAGADNLLGRTKAPTLTRREIWWPADLPESADFSAAMTTVNSEE